MRIFIIALAVLYWAGASLAKSINIGPDECPVFADIAAIGPGDANADDLNAWRGAGEIDPIIDIDVNRPPQAGRAFYRLWVDGETGETLRNGARLCGE